MTYWLLTQNVPFSSLSKLCDFVRGSVGFPLGPLLSKNITNEGIKFLQKALAIQPLERFTALIALDDPWLKDIEQVSFQDGETQISPQVALHVDIASEPVIEDAPVTQLLRRNGFDVDAANFNPNTALLWAATKDREGNIIQILLERGADVAAKDSIGRTALHWAAENGYKTAVQLLLTEGADVDAKDHTGRAVLHRTAERGQEALVQLLLEKGADATAEDNLGRTALHWAAENGYENIVLLLLHNGADVEAKDALGRTARDWAMGNGQESMFQLLTALPLTLDS